MAQQAKDIQVNFTLESPTLSEDSTVYITGSIAPLGNWNPGAVKMNYNGNHSWNLRITVSQAASIEYKFTLGSWDHEAAGADGKPLPNFSADVQRDTSITQTVINWTAGTQHDVTTHRVTGTLQYHPAMKGAGLKDRDVVVWLPPGYDSAADMRYPVLYMQDGQNVFDPATSSFGIEWGVDETCDSLIRTGKIPPLIVVGIYNTDDRSFEYAPGRRGEAYMNFMIKTLKPFIDSAYRTQPAAESTWVGGSSLGGLISFMLAWQHPDIFSKSLCFSPAFRAGPIDYVKTVTAYKGKQKPVSFYIDNGSVGLDAQLQPGILAMIAALKRKGYKDESDIKYVSDIGATHSEASWSKRFPGAIIWCTQNVK